MFKRLWEPDSVSTSQMVLCRLLGRQGLLVLAAKVRLGKLLLSISQTSKDPHFLTGSLEQKPYSYILATGGMSRRGNAWGLGKSTPYLPSQLNHLGRHTSA